MITLLTNIWVVLMPVVISVRHLGLETHQSLDLGLGLSHLRFVPETNFRPNCAGQNNKMSQFTLGVPSSFR